MEDELRRLIAANDDGTLTNEQLQRIAAAIIAAGWHK